MNNFSLNSPKTLNFKSIEQMQVQQNAFAPQSAPEARVELPQIYKNSMSQISENDFKDSVKKADMMGLVTPWLEHPFIMVGTCAGLIWGLDKFSNACSGDYEKSLVGKASHLGDRIENSKFVKSKPVQSVLNGGKKAGQKISKVFRNSDLVNAFKNTPAQPEWTMPKHEMLNMEQNIAQTFSHTVNKLVSPDYKDGTKYVKLGDLGLDKKDNEFLKKFFGSANASQEAKSNVIQLKRLGFADDAIKEIIAKPEASEIVKGKYFEKFGFDKEFLARIKNDAATKDDLVKIRQACKDMPNVRVGEGHKSFLGPLQIFERKVSFSEIGNKLRSIGEAKTKTGKAFATFLQKCHRGFTFGGGKMNLVFFVAPFLYESMRNVKKAEPDQKFSTAMHGLTHSISWVFTFPIAVNILYRLGGLRYAGMSKEAVEESRKLIKEFNEKANPYVGKRSFFEKLLGKGVKKPQEETFQTIEEYKTAKKALKTKLKDLSKAKDQNLLTKIGKRIGKIITMDLETISSFKNGGNFGNKLRGLGNNLRNIGGVPLKFLLWAGISMGVLDTLINKGLKTCFGGHYDGMVEDEFNEVKKEQKKFLKEDLQNRLYDAQKEKVLGLNKPVNEQIKPVENQKNKQDTDELMQKRITEMNQETEALSKENSVANNEQENLDNVDDEIAKVVNDSEQKNDSVIVPPPNLSSINETKLAKENNNNEGEKVAKLSVDNYDYIPSSTPIKLNNLANKKLDNYTYIPSSENVLKKAISKNNVGKYIPSQRAVQVTKTFDNSGLDKVLKKADKAEKRAIEVLNGNFSSY